MSAEEVLKSDEWQELKTIFGDEAPRGAHYFQTPQYSDDGSGYFVSVIHGEKGSKKSFVYLGWMPAICL
jgi:hypothetical protein